MSEVLRTFAEELFKLDVPADISALIAGYSEQNLNWDRLNTGESFVISEESPSILRLTNDAVWSVAVADVIFERGFKFSFSVRVLDLGSDCFYWSFGVLPAASSVLSSTHLMISWPKVGGWEWWYSRGIARHLLQSTPYGGNAVCDGALITVHVDFTKETMGSSNGGTVSFSGNSEHYGVAFDDVVPPVKPAVSLYSAGSSLEIVNISLD